MYIREYQSSDCEEIAELFYNTVHSVNRLDYSDEQLNAWATGDLDLNEWDKTFKSHYTIVAIYNDIIVGFGDIDTKGYLDRLYVHKDFQRRGIASAICEKLENYISVRKIITHSSITAKPFFEKRGYRTLRRQKVKRKEILLENYVMEKVKHNNIFS